LYTAGIRDWILGKIISKKEILGRVKNYWKFVIGDWGLGIGDWGLGIGNPIVLSIINTRR
jgi:hypothetical protein